jgi:FtsP/CotA-like multicopper oxidase with cupredoxin domain
MLKLARLAVAAVLLAACSSTTAPAPAPTKPSEPAPQAPSAPAPPPVWGVSALEDTNPDPNVVEVSLTAGTARLPIAGKEIDLLTFNGSFPGPLLEAKVGDEIIVHFKNTLSEPTTIHWHGLRISDQMDGSPRIQQPVPPGGEFTYRFKAPEAGSFWYHPHVRAHDQIERGLYGPMIIRGAGEPTYDLERYLLVDDILVSAGKVAPPSMVGMTAMHGRAGNTWLTNGQKSADFRGEATQGAVERWRIVNTSNSLVEDLELEGATFRVIGTDGGLLREPYTTKRVLVAVGQRYDLEVVYDRPGTAVLKRIELDQDANGKIIDVPIPVFAVDVAASDKAPREIAWPDLAPLPDRKEDQTVRMEFDAVNGANGVEWRINGMSHAMHPLFTFKKGQTVRIVLDNKLGPYHPFHLHGQFFKIASRKEPGLKDTVLVPGMETVEIVAYMDNPGRWMAHCHILEHAELGMMTEIVVEP